MKTRNHGIAWIALLALAFVAGACGKSKTPETAGTPGAEGTAPEAAADARIEWGMDTLWAEAQLPATEASKRKITLQFAPGGDARMTTDYVDRGTGMDVGWWSVRNDTLAVQLATIDGKASGTTSTWTVKGMQMTPLVYNREEWGPDGIPFRILRRAAPSN
jgi:hypothetical protein